jgi:hypothetical protein
MRVKSEPCIDALAREPGPRLSPPNAVRAGFSDRPEVPTSSAAATGRPGWRMEREVGYAIGWLFVISGVLAVLVMSCFPRYGYRTPPPGCFLVSLAF